MRVRFLITMSLCCVAGKTGENSPLLFIVCSHYSQKGNIYIVQSLSLLFVKSAKTNILHG